MAVSLTLIELAADLRLGDGVNAPAEPVNGVLTRDLATATAIVEKHAPTAPDTAHNTAAARLCGYWYFQPPASRHDGYANALVNSGAASALRDWRVSPTALIDGE